MTNSQTVGLRQNQKDRLQTWHTPAEHLPNDDPMQTLLIELSRAVLAGKVLPARSMRDWLQQCVIIPDGKHKGKRFNFDTQPVVGLFVDAIDSGLFNEFVFTAPSQFGKTLIAFIAPLLYHTCEVAENYVLGVPHADMASDKWDLDVKPVLQASAALRRLTPASGTGSAGGKVRDRVTLRNGVEIKLMSAGANDQGKAGFTARVIGITEAAAFSLPGESSDEADPLRQLRARQRSYHDHERSTYIEGTVTIAEALPWNLKPVSSDSKIVCPCPHCDTWIAPERDDLIGWEEAETEVEAAECAFWACPNCGQQIEEQERHAAVRAAKLLHAGQKIDSLGRISGEMRKTTRLFFRANAFHNLFLDAASIGKDEWLAQRIPEDSPERISADRQLCQFVHCVPYEDPRFLTELVLDKKRIGSRRMTDLPENVLPEDTKWLGAGIDVGQYKCWYQTWALRIDDAGDEFWHVPTYGFVEVPGDRMELDAAIKHALREIHELLQSGFSIYGGRKWKRPDAEWYDAGFRPDPVLEFVREINEHNGLPAGKQKYTPWIASFGRGLTSIAKTRFSAPRKSGNIVRDVDPAGLWYVERVQRAKTYAVLWDSDTSKWELQQALTIEQFEDGAGQQQTPGSVTMFAGPKRVHERCVTHWMNEHLETVKTVTGDKRRWKRKGDNHLLDCGAAARRAISRARYIAEKSLYLPPTVDDHDATEVVAQPQDERPRDPSREVNLPSRTRAIRKPRTSRNATKKGWYER